MRKNIFWISFLILSVIWTNSVLANGIDFDKVDDRIEYGDVTILDGASAATWIMIADIDTLSAEMEAFNKWDEDVGSTQAFILWLDSSGDDIGACVTNTTSNYSCHNSDTSAVSTSGIQCMAWVWSGSNNWAFYVNGSDVGDNAIYDAGTVATLPNTSTSLYIGIGEQSGFRNPFDGKIYEYAIWDTNLSSAQVSNFCASELNRITLQTSPFSLKLYTPLDDVAEGVSADEAVIKDLSSSVIDGSGEDGSGSGLLGVPGIYSYP